MKKLGLAVLASMVAISAHAAETNCSGWTVQVLDKSSGDVKVWCPQAGENFTFKLPGWKEPVCKLLAMKKMGAVGTDPKKATYSRRLECSVRGVVVSTVAGWFPNHQVDPGVGIGEFSLTDEAKDAQFSVSAFHMDNAL